MNEETAGKLAVSKANGDAHFHNYFKNGQNGAEMKPSRAKHEEFEETPLLTAVTTYIAYALLILFGYLRDFLRYYGLEKSKAFTEKGNEVGDLKIF